MQIEDQKISAKQDTSLIKSERLFLRSFTISDVNERYLRWMQDPEVIKFLIGRRETYTINSLRQYVEKILADCQYKFFAIVHRPTGEHIGNAKLGPIDYGNRVSSLGLLIGEKQYWGNGYGTEAIYLATRFAFERLELNKLMAGCTVLNHASIKAFERAGYVQEGLFRKMGLFDGVYLDAVQFGILADELPQVPISFSSDSTAKKGESETESLKLQEKAARLIPGNTQLLSKNPEQFAPGVWPGYFQKARGAEVWDLDGKHYLDMSLSGVGACVLGYRDPDVDQAVMTAVQKGTMSTLNCPEEVELAERLCSLHGWAEQARFAKSGGESMAIAVRIARAHTSREVIAFCGYHGWHDWYLAANLSNPNALNEHLLKNILPNGVPRSLTGTAIPFRFNHIEDLKAIARSHASNLAAIVLEPIRDVPPAPDFLNAVREIATQTKAVLIFDEISSGFRLTTGGAHLLYGAHPDIAVFAKALGNGYPIGAVIGRHSVMSSVQQTFISSTYWTERIGAVAAIATIKKFQTFQVEKHLHHIGEQVKRGWAQAAAKSGITIKIGGFAHCPHFVFEMPKESAGVLKAFFVQVMLEQGFLASTLFYPMYAHQTSHVDVYLEAVENAFCQIADGLAHGNLKEKLKGRPAESGFRRFQSESL